MVIEGDDIGAEISPDHPLFKDVIEEKQEALQDKSQLNHISEGVFTKWINSVRKTRNIIRCFPKYLPYEQRILRILYEEQGAWLAKRKIFNKMKMLAELITLLQLQYRNFTLAVARHAREKAKRNAIKGS